MSQQGMVDATSLWPKSNTPRAPSMYFLALLIFLPTLAQAAGIFIAPRGVRPLARGGAFIAGAEGVSSMAHNPAGLVETKGDFTFDLGLPLHRTEVSRRVFADSPDEPTVVGEGFNLPSPTLGASHDLFLNRDFRLGLALMADYPNIQNYPETLDDGSPAPTRYSVINYDGTLLLKFGIAAAYDILNYVSIGVGVNMMWGSFGATNAVSACDGTICTQPENPDYDTYINMNAQNMFAATPHLGIIIKPARWLRFGFAWEYSYHLEQDAKLRVRLPSAGAYRGASVVPEEPTAKIALDLPMVIRTGVETRIKDFLRIEASFVWEQWSVHDDITIDIQNTTIEPVLTLGSYSLETVALDRGFQDTWSVRLGLEGYIPLPKSNSPLVVRGGVMYEPSAVPVDKLTALTVDLDKVIVAGGLSYGIAERFHIEATYAAVVMLSQRVENSSVFQINPTRPTFSGVTPVGNGSYRSSAHILGFGLRVDFDLGSKRGYARVDDQEPRPEIDTSLGDESPPEA